MLFYISLLTKSLNPDLIRIWIHYHGANSYNFEFTHPEAIECGSGFKTVVFTQPVCNLMYFDIVITTYE
jgi:hypothetical protein